MAGTGIVSLTDSSKQGRLTTLMTLWKANALSPLPAKTNLKSPLRPERGHSHLRCRWPLWVTFRFKVARQVRPLRLQRHLRFEVRREPASCCHLVFLRQSVEYTLATCPIFRDHLRRSWPGISMRCMGWRRPGWILDDHLCNLEFPETVAFQSGKWVSARRC